MESIVREVSDKVLSEPGVSKEKLLLRAVALDMMAEVSAFHILLEIHSSCQTRATWSSVPFKFSSKHEIRYYSRSAYTELY